ncbi:MAG: PAS domain-containing protein [Anaerolineae bacterium]|nr:PAS domain-containing protein [Anaerolineae bacterium]
MLGTYEDITERKRSEQIIKENNERLQLALQAASMGTWEWSIMKNHMVWSPETLKVFSIHSEEFGGTYEAYLAFATPESRQEVDEKIQSFLRESRHSAVIQYEHKIIRGDGTSGWIEMRGALFLDHTDQPVRMIGVCADVSARKGIAVQLEAYTAELERSNRELQEFAYVASHDLQEPLRKIQTFGDRLQNKYNPVLDERGQDYLERMQSAAARMQALIVDLLSFSRVRTHGQPFGEVDLHQTVLQVLQDLEIKIAEVQAEIIVADLLVIEADALQMKQLFQNLLSNALKFYRPGIPLKINVRSRVVESFCEIVVVDNGIGFDQKYTDRIFIVFERLHGRDVYPGTGVGLAICRRIVERHNGYIRVQSKLGEGSTFIVGLPVKQTLSATATNHEV